MHLWWKSWEPQPRQEERSFALKSMLAQTLYIIALALDVLMKPPLTHIGTAPHLPTLPLLFFSPKSGPQKHPYLFAHQHITNSYAVKISWKTLCSSKPYLLSIVLSQLLKPLGARFLDGRFLSQLLKPHWPFLHPSRLHYTALWLEELLHGNWLPQLIIENAWQAFPFMQLFDHLLEVYCFCGAKHRVSPSLDP